ncbi:nucleotidyltransferase domain-containing protein [Kitasatospora sp. NPDC087315]|uniref:nucleotidyltransferase domain-containing protein n=1 Tax=Kitasatospora sp. NPDC087315 TaxID=3364069 RepID=UPI0038061689
MDVGSAGSSDQGRADRQLAQIAETVGLARRLGVRVWLRGGWAMDFFLGELTRDHGGMDKLRAVLNH